MAVSPRSCAAMARASSSGGCPPGRRYALRAMAGDRVAWSGTAQADPAGRLAFTIDGDGLAGLLLEATPIGDGAS